MIRNLTVAQRDMLIEHIDGEVRVERKKSDGARTALLSRGLLRPTRMHNSRPRGTVLTDDGRRVLGIVLGSYADALVRASMLEPPTQLHIRGRLKELRSILPVSDSGFPADGAGEPDPASPAGLTPL